MTTADVSAAIAAAQATLQSVVQNGAAGSQNVVAAQSAIAQLQTATTDLAAVANPAPCLPAAPCPTPSGVSWGAASLMIVGGLLIGGLAGWAALEHVNATRHARPNPLRRRRP